MIELMIIILILGILAGISGPKYLGASESASEARLRYTLTIVRDSIELYAAAHEGDLPGADSKQATLKADLAPYLIFWPENPHGADPAKSDQIIIRSSPIPLFNQVNNQEGWIYNSRTGEFRANNNGLSSDGETKYCEF